METILASKAKIVSNHLIPQKNTLYSLRYNKYTIPAVPAEQGHIHEQRRIDKISYLNFRKP